MDEHDLCIEKLVYGGDGLAREDGRVALVPFVLPGEMVRARLSRAKNDLLRGRVTEILSASLERVQPECPFFFRCGGCQYQHSDYRYQLEQKRSILRDVLRRITRIEVDAGLEVVSAEPWKYRNRTQLHIGGGRIGYFEQGSHRLCAIDRCPISSPKLNEVIGCLAAEMPRLPRFEATLELFTNEVDLQFNPHDRVPAQFRTVLGRLGTNAPIVYEGFRVSRGSFFQVNRFLIRRLVDEAVEGTGGEMALDLYAGVGLFTLRLAQSFRQVTSVEASASAFGDLGANIDQAGATNVYPVREISGAHLSRIAQPPDLILADPPRGGLGPTVVTELLRVRCPCVVIVSCDPATLARDLGPLLAGGYSLQKITLVDLFPQTAHFETVVRLGLGLV